MTNATVRKLKSFGPRPLLGRGYVGNIVTVLEPKKKKTSTVTIVAFIVLASVAGFATYEISRYEPVVGPDSVNPDSVEVPVFAHETIANTWTVPTQQMLAEQGNKSLVSLYPDDRFIQCFLVSFNYSGKPTAFVNASVSFPLAWYAAGGNDTVYPVSIYEVLSPWKPWANSTQKDGVTWRGVQNNAPVVGRNPIDTVWMNSSTFGVGRYAEGNLTFDVTEAINDWGEGWCPDYGFLVSIIAPWETTDYPWVRYDSYVTSHYYVCEASLLIVLAEAIPEFGDLIVPLVGMLVIVFVVGKRRREEMR